jgi:hypothetical protein
MVDLLYYIRVIDLRINWMRLVISQSRIQRNFRKILLHQSHQTINDHKVFIFIG